jgi:hypothetical protein
MYILGVGFEARVEKMRQDFIERCLKTLKSDAKPEKKEKALQGLRKCGLSQSEIDELLLEVTPNPAVSPVPKDKGYKKGTLNSGEQMYVLACNHQIRAKKHTGIFSKGMLGKTVWCDVCNTERIVTSAPSWVD